MRLDIVHGRDAAKGPITSPTKEKAQLVKIKEIIWDK
jgi:hypothetical protein